MPVSTSPWPTVLQVAERHQVSVNTVRNWIASGRIRAERFGPKLLRIDPESLETLGQPLRPTEAND